MTFLSLGFFTGFSLILAIGAQNIFVIEQGLKRQFIFIVCLICALSDLILIFIGIFLFEYSYRRNWTYDRPAAWSAGPRWLHGRWFRRTAGTSTGGRGGSPPLVS